LGGYSTQRELLAREGEPAWLPGNIRQNRAAEFEISDLRFLRRAGPGHLEIYAIYFWDAIVGEGKRDFKEGQAQKQNEKLSIMISIWHESEPLTR
jgi:hypothetical protein